MYFTNIETGKNGILPESSVRTLRKTLEVVSKRCLPNIQKGSFRIGYCAKDSQSLEPEIIMQGHLPHGPSREQLYANYERSSDEIVRHSENEIASWAAPSAPKLNIPRIYVHDGMSAAFLRSDDGSFLISCRLANGDRRSAEAEQTFFYAAMVALGELRPDDMTLEAEVLALPEDAEWVRRIVSEAMGHSPKLHLHTPEGVCYA